MIDKKEIEFKDESTGLVYEKIVLELPKQIVTYYRAIATLQNVDALSLIEKEIIHNLEKTLDSITGPDAKKLLNLYPVFEAKIRFNRRFVVTV